LGLAAAAAAVTMWATAQLHRREWQTRMQNEEEDRGGVERGKKGTPEFRHTGWSKNRATDYYIQPDCYCRWSPPRVSPATQHDDTRDGNQRQIDPTDTSPVASPTRRYPLRLRGASENSFSI
jgi:hypothetical protein